MSRGIPIRIRRVFSPGRRKMQNAAVERKMQAVRRATEHEFPVADVDQMLDEIARGRNVIPSE